MQQLTEATADDIERARMEAHQARNEVKRFSALKQKAVEDCDPTAHETYSNALDVWKLRQESRLLNLANLLLDMYPEGAQVS